MQPPPGPMSELRSKGRWALSPLNWSRILLVKAAPHVERGSIHRGGPSRRRKAGEARLGGMAKCRHWEQVPGRSSAFVTLATSPSFLGLSVPIGKRGWFE